jgi:hypothetical protein
MARLSPPTALPEGPLVWEGCVAEAGFQSFKTRSVRTIFLQDHRPRMRQRYFLSIIASHTSHTTPKASSAMTIGDERVVLASKQNLSA